MTSTPPDTTGPGTSALERHVREGRDTSGDDVLVAPRYLAGGSWSPTDAFVPLTHHYWHDMNDELGNFYITTMGSQLRVAFVPEASELMPDATALWQIRARDGWPPREVWSAAFTDDTPPEIIAAVTAELDATVTADHGRERYIDRGITHDEDPAQVWEVFRAAKWQVTASGFLAHAQSSDELVRVAYRDPRRVGRDEAWLATVRDPGGARRPLWEAWFHSATPTRVVRAFAAALTDPAPVSREAESLTASCRPYATPLHPPAPVPQPAAVPTPLELAHRLRNRATALQAVSVPRWFTGTTTRTIPPAPLATVPARPVR
ncbi:DUF317 domain-containing protein [Streptomyces sp. HPF1205]|uniref:DUF317 domain-containing protein n=1 Tax=Streptomyces sp. HPF1205 TaxID=2873262 RepID=UPI001CEC124F|nr:DUF317 domain-containing protein [Streptomyces sp. HPF1205]